MTLTERATRNPYETTSVLLEYNCGVVLHVLPLQGMIRPLSQCMAAVIETTDLSFPTKQTQALYLPLLVFHRYLSLIKF